MRRSFVVLFLTLWCASSLSAATVDGLPIHYSSSGDGPATLIFVHGWTCDETSWSAQVGPFREHYRVVTLDLPGHGQSASPSDGKFSMDLFARAVESVRAEVGADRVVLIGHSMGAPVIREYTKLYPQHVAALVPVDGPISMKVFAAMLGVADGAQLALPNVGGPEGLQTREGMIRNMFTADTPVPLQEQILAMMLKTPEATAVGAMAAIGDPKLWEDPSIPMPVLAVYAGTAQVPDPALIKTFAPRYEATQMAGTGHFLMMEQPDEFNRLLGDFVQRIEF